MTRSNAGSATPLVLLIASLGALAMLQNAVAMLFTTNMLQFSYPWRTQTVSLGVVSLSYAQLIDRGDRSRRVRGAGVDVALDAARPAHPRGGVESVSGRDHAPAAAQRLFVAVMMIASGIVALAGILIGLDQAMQPYTGVLVLLTATIAVIAGGIGSLTGAFVDFGRAVGAAEPVAGGDARSLEHRGDLRPVHPVHPHQAAKACSASAEGARDRHDLLPELHHPRDDLLDHGAVDQSAGRHHRHLLGVAGGDLRRRRLYRGAAAARPCRVVSAGHDRVR